MQLATLAFATVLIVASNVRALILNTPTSVVAGNPLEITFEARRGDPVFSIELKNNDLHDEFAIANNVNPKEGSITVIIPCVPASGGYEFDAVNITNINDIFATTAEFTVTQGPNC